jgi:hypothetical protein
MALLIEYYEGVLKLDAVTFDGTGEEAALAAGAGLKALAAATQARIYDEGGRLIATVHPEA